MAKRGGLGRGLDALIPDKKPAKTEKAGKEAKSSKKASGSRSGGKKAEQKSAKASRNVSADELQEMITPAEADTAAGISKTAGSGKETKKMSSGKGTEEIAVANGTDEKASEIKSEETSGVKEAEAVTSEMKTEETAPENEAAESGSSGEQAEFGVSGEQGESGASVMESETQAHEKEGEVILLKISDVEPNRGQPRKYFDDAAIAELADSIRQFGIIQPLLVQKKDDYYEIIAGERRWRAAQKAGLKEVPVIIKQFTNQEAVEVALIENIQREDLNPIEEAKAYERLVREYGLSQESVAQRVSKSRSAVTNSMRLLRLDEAVQKMVETGRISEGHARAILGIPAPDVQTQLAETVIKERLSVRQTEKLVRDILKPKKEKPRETENRTNVLLEGLAENLKTALSTKVSIRATGKSRGKIEIEYYSDEDLDRIYEMLLSARS